MRIEKVAAIDTYLAEKFPDCKIEHKHDLNHHAEAYKIWVDMRSFLLRIACEFIDDHPAETLIDKLEKWKVTDLLTQSDEAAISVTDSGPSSFNRQ